MQCVSGLKEMSGNLRYNDLAGNYKYQNYFLLCVTLRILKVCLGFITS